jgi:hypothetical protein
LESWYLCVYYSDLINVCFQIFIMARVICKRPRIRDVKVLIKKMKLTVKKLSVNLKSMKLSVRQIKELAWEEDSIAKPTVVVKVVKDTAFRNVSMKFMLRNKFVKSSYLKTYDVEAEILDCLVMGKVSRLKTCPKSPYSSYELGSQKAMEEDNEDSPKKKIPSWAEEKAVMRAVMVDVDTDLIFAPCDPPDLSDMFPITASRRRNLWDSPTSSLTICDTPKPSDSDDEEISFNLDAREMADNKHRTGEPKQLNLVKRKVLFQLDSTPTQKNRC